ncbi:hypothetical protein ABXI76_31030 [Streptomyces parvus]
MVEILENLDLLSRPNLDLAAVEVNGIALGAPAATVPRERIASGLSPVIARYRGGTDIEGEYFAADGRSLTLEEIIDDVVRSDGFLYGVDKINYKVRAGAVVGFAISGPHLSHFAHLTSYEEFLAAFGLARSRARERGVRRPHELRGLLLGFSEACDMGRVGGPGELCQPGRLRGEQRPLTAR